jgi:hypothetical protein
VIISLEALGYNEQNCETSFVPKRLNFFGGGTGRERFLPEADP